MELSQEVSNQASGVTVAGKEYPSFRQRSVNTTLTVGQRQTIVIGGLIQENQDATESGLPLLSKIPFLKYLVGTHKKTASRTELIISITPYVIVSLEDVDSVTNEFQKKNQSVKTVYTPPFTDDGVLTVIDWMLDVRV